MKKIILVSSILLASCAPQTVQTDIAKFNSFVSAAVGNINGDVAALAPALQNICAAGSYADLGFKTVAAVAQVDAAKIADEERAVNALSDVCAHPPTNTAAAVATAVQAYKDVQNATPAVAK